MLCSLLSVFWLVMLLYLVYDHCATEGVSQMAATLKRPANVYTGLLRKGVNLEEFLKKVKEKCIKLTGKQVLPGWEIDGSATNVDDEREFTVSCPADVANIVRVFVGGDVQRFRCEAMANTSKV